VAPNAEPVVAGPALVLGPLVLGPLAPLAVAPDIGTGRRGAWPDVKSNPQASQNWPDLGFPQCGQGCADDGAACSDAAVPASPDAGPLAAGLLPAWPLPLDPAMRIPHTSQKSVLAES
jgi:hypothetical protein